MLNDNRNFEGYKDLTAHSAIQNIEGRGFYMPVVYICSAYRGDTQVNVMRARRYCKFAVSEYRIPIAPHLLFPQFMSELDERDIALHMDYVLVTKCVEMWVFGEITEGMAHEIDIAEKRNMPIRYFDTDCKESYRN